MMEAQWQVGVGRGWRRLSDGAARWRGRKEVEGQAKLVRGGEGLYNRDNMQRQLQKEEVEQ